MSATHLSALMFLCYECDYLLLISRGWSGGGSSRFISVSGGVLGRGRIGNKSDQKIRSPLVFNSALHGSM